LRYAATTLPNVQIGAEGPLERNRANGIGDTGLGPASVRGAADSGADSIDPIETDPDLAAIVGAWPSLSPVTKETIVALIQRAGAWGDPMLVEAIASKNKQGQRNRYSA